MTPHILIINGPPGVGKSALSAALRELMPGTACISGDVLRSFAPADARTTLGGGSTYRAAARLASFYLEAGAPRVVFDYVFETPAQLDYFGIELGSAFPWRVVTLWAALSTIQIRDAQRSGIAHQGSRVVNCVSTMAPHLQNLGDIVDTDERPVLQVAAHVHRMMQGF